MEMEILNSERTTGIENSYEPEGSTKNQKRTTKFKTLLKTFCTYGSIILLCFMYGFNHTSFNNIKNISLDLWSKEFFPEHHELMENLPPTFFFLGGLIGAVTLYFKKVHDFKLILQISSFVLFVAYALNVAIPYIIVVYLVRLLTGMASGAISIVIPQILHKMASKEKKALMSSIFPFFLLVGLTTAVALIPLCTEDLYKYVNSIPCVISGIAFLMLLNTIELETFVKDNSKVNFMEFMTSSATIKSALLIIFLHLIQKTTGVDFIGLFSSKIFSGENSYIYSLIPLLIAIGFTGVSGLIADFLGRKIPVAIGLFGLSITCFLIYCWGSNIFTVSAFIIMYNCGLNVVPYMYQNEVVPLTHKAVANEVGGIFSWIFSIGMALFIAFFYQKGSNFIWASFAGMSFVAFFAVVLFMKETADLEVYSFVRDFFNLFSWKFFGKKTESRSLA